VKALEAIGTTLGRVITVDLKASGCTYQKGGQILVELDIHEGLQESLDIELWAYHLSKPGLPWYSI
jgi:hypothetical protein